MSEPSSPFDIAREALRQMALRRVPPTPDNYLKFYHETAGTVGDTKLSAEQFARNIGRRLLRDSVERQRLAHGFDQAVAKGDLQEADEAIGRYLDRLKPAEPPAWNELIGNLLRLWEVRQHGWTAARKREALDRVLAAADPSTLHARLQGLLRSWSQAGSDGDIEATREIAREVAREPGTVAAPATSAKASAAIRPSDELDEDGIHTQLRKLLGIGLSNLVSPFLAPHPELGAETADIAAQVDKAVSFAAFDPLAARMKALAFRLEIVAADDREIRNDLLELLRLLLDNIDQLVLEDTWLAGQVEMLREIVDSTPTRRSLNDAGHHLRGVIYKQSQLRQAISESQHQLRTMLAGFLDQLAHFADNTGSYHDQLTECARDIANARDISEIAPALNKVMRQTRSMQEGAKQAHGELVAARAQAQSAEARITALQNELDEASRQMRHDQLTGALNRRGIEEMFEKEVSHAQRRRAPLSVGVLDIDNFKKLNDTYGHDIGDEALVHLTQVVRQHLRPQDSLARYGGEEFVILLPDANENDASQALVRLQRELTRTFFMAEQNRLIITFSAGVAELAAGEDIESALKRADTAMYEAKRSGRNRVVASRTVQKPV